MNAETNQLTNLSQTRTTRCLSSQTHATEHGMASIVPEKPALGAVDLDKALQHPDVPPIELASTLAVQVPAAPFITKITQLGTPKYLKTLYSTAVQAYWPVVEKAKQRCGADVLIAAAQILQDSNVRPANYLEWCFGREVSGKKPRKTPPVIQVVFDPEEVSKSIYAVNLQYSEVSTCASTTVHVGPYLRDVSKCILWVHREIRNLPSYDEARITEISRQAFPGGWVDEVSYAQQYVHAQSDYLVHAISTGVFVWGRATNLVLGVRA